MLEKNNQNQELVEKPKHELIDLSEAIIKSKFYAGVAGLNDLSKEALELEFNEDNIETIKEFLDKCNRLDKKIEQVYEEGKAPAYNIYKRWLSVKKIFNTTVKGVVDSVKPRYVKLVKEKNDRIAREEAEKQRNLAILSGIENNIVAFMARISECKTSGDIVAIERIINLEKSRKSKYGKYFDLAIEKYNQLTEHISKQKLVVKELEAIKEELSSVNTISDAEVIEERKQDTNEEIQRMNDDLQLNVLSSFSSNDDVAVVIDKKVKPKRTLWKYEIQNIETVFKKRREYLDISLNASKCNEALKGIRGSEMSERDEVVLDGIRFYKEEIF